MSYTVVQDKDQSLKVTATIRTTQEWDDFCMALAKYRNKFEPNKTTVKEISK